MHRNILTSFSGLELQIVVGIANGLSVICDVVIVVALCYYLESKRTGLGRCALAIWSARWQVDAAYILYSTNWTIDRLMLYAVNRGALTA